MTLDKLTELLLSLARHMTHLGRLGVCTRARQDAVVDHKALPRPPPPICASGISLSRPRPSSRHSNPICCTGYLQLRHRLGVPPRCMHFFHSPPAQRQLLKTANEGPPRHPFGPTLRLGSAVRSTRLVVRLRVVSGPSLPCAGILLEAPAARPQRAMPPRFNSTWFHHQQTRDTTCSRHESNHLTGKLSSAPGPDAAIVACYHAALLQLHSFCTGCPGIACSLSAKSVPGEGCPCSCLPLPL